MIAFGIRVRLGRGWSRCEDNPFGWGWEIGLHLFGVRVFADFVKGQTS